jgi:flagellar hook-length control protein FliK
VILQMPQGITPSHPAWPQVVSERMAWVAGQQVQSATLQLDPPELGSLQVKLQIANEQVSVTFVSPHASTRDALEQSLPRLREMLAEQGMSLGESFVNDQSSGGSKGEKDESAKRVGYNQSNAEVDASSEVVSHESISLVDYYA